MKCLTYHAVKKFTTEHIDSDPTIRPVMDMTDVMNGFQTIDGLFSANRTISSGYFSGLTGVRSARALWSEQQGKISPQTDNKDVVNELKNLSKLFDELSNSVKNMQAVLDTGVLVGQTSEKMDSQLGTLASRRGRGN